MNPTAADQPPPLPPAQPPRSSFSCDRHPEEQFSGFCPECLCERLTTLDHSASTNNPSSSSRRPSTSSSSAAAAFKSLFSKPSASSAAPSLPPPPPKPSKPSSFFPELRRTKSFSASKNEALGFSTASFEPQRRSCDVRVRNTLWGLFSIDNETRPSTSQNPHCSENAGDFVNRPVLESNEEEDEKEVSNEQVFCESRNGSGEIEEITELPESSRSQNRLGGVINSEIAEDECLKEDVSKPMKDHIDLDSQAKKHSGGMMEIAGSFWSAASVFSKKWHKWRQKQKHKKSNAGRSSTTLPAEKKLSRHFRETQSEIADYGFGRRSCDTDPRFSLDAGRISFDDPRYSFDEPRASWDGHMIGKTFPRIAPMVSVVEDDAPPVIDNVSCTATKIPVEDPFSIMKNCIDEEDDTLPGGSAQTRNFYADSSSKRRKSLDRSGSVKKPAAVFLAAEISEMKAVSNAKVLPADRDSNSNSLRDDCSETSELAGFRDNNAPVIGNGERKGSKKSRRWAWNILGFIYRRNGGGSKDDEYERYSRPNGIERSFSASWQDLRGGVNKKAFRSNSSVSRRYSSSYMGGSFGHGRKSSVEMNGNVSKRKEDFGLERNRSARFSPKHFDNGLLRFYLTPMSGSRRGKSSNRLNGTHSFGRSMLRLYS
ncbi:unnamed protein product [Cuscuta epithymum]|uniref:Uncharacterized protein n=1 Tax=Cuscuta epithymum TaxID=186058 RepID=A0AAV0GJR6_9ASTE|nr:unnamed protein product [Cuscuta epithymum]